MDLPQEVSAMEPIRYEPVKDTVAVRMGFSTLQHRGLELLWRRIRRQWVLRDRQLAALLGLRTRGLSLRTRRRAADFPEDFAFRLTAAEFARFFPYLNGAPTRPGGREPMVCSTAGILQHLLAQDPAARVRTVRWLAGVLPARTQLPPEDLWFNPRRS
ncbi:MAG: hypothetical protein EYC70_12850 [Planctomycetota bacterium]|nr:MAG: hypothetical protein EYC70_12850 [Planctomycetota bacterium]